MTASPVYLIVYIIAGFITQQGMVTNIVKYKLIIFSLHERFCLSLI